MEKYESTFRLPVELAERLDTLSQVLGKSKNQLITEAVKETILFYETSDEFVRMRDAWIARVTRI